MDAGASLVAFIAAHAPVLVLTGAGLSAPSGLPPYRDAEGQWQHPRPMPYADFVGDPAHRRRYWYRSAAGWPRFAAARPNAAHRALAALEEHGLIGGVVTQNVDGLHQAAGSRTVVDLHGRLDHVRCLACGDRSPRAALQGSLQESLRASPARTGPDGDADLEAAPADYPVPACRRCGGLLKPDVVFFGEPLDPAVAARARKAVDDATAVLVVGSSLMVFSGYRLVRDAAASGKPVASLGLGRTRADELLTLRVQGDCSQLLPSVAAQMLDSRGSTRLEKVIPNARPVGKKL